MQLFENAPRIGDKTYLHGLDRSVERHPGLDFMEVQRWAKVKKQMNALMSTDIFARRPLDEKTTEYLVLRQ